MKAIMNSVYNKHVLIIDNDIIFVKKINDFKTGF